MLLFVVQIVTAALPVRSDAGTLLVEICGAGGLQTVSLRGETDDTEPAAQSAKCPFCILSVADTGTATDPLRIAVTFHAIPYPLAPVPAPAEHPATSRTIRGPPLTT